MKVPTPKKMSSGNWYINLRLGGESISVTEPTEKACIRAAQLIKAEYLAGKRIEKSNPKKTTLSQAIDNYIASRENVLSPSTIRGYRLIQKHRFSDIMNLPVSSITSAIAQRSINAARSEFSAKTITNSWRFIQTVLTKETGSTFQVSLPQIIKEPHAFLTDSQIRIFTEAVKGTRYEIPALLALCSLRRSELLALTWDDVDLSNAVAHVRSSVVLDEHNTHVKKRETKNASSRRTVPLMPQLVSALSAVADKSGPVVTISGNTLYLGVNRICKENGLPEVGVHGLRHSFASLAYSLGLPEKITMEIGGWSDDATMKKIYTHLAQNDLHKAANKILDFYKQP